MPSPFPECRPFTEPYDRAELRADAVMHVAGVAFAVCAMVFLMAKADALPDLQSASIRIYGLTLLTTFAVSAAYNLWPISSVKLMLRRFDHSAIFLFIAASYTPFIVHAQIEWSRALLAAIWGVGLVGVILRLGCPARFERLSVILCLVLGWSGLFVYDAIFGRLPASTVGLVVGGGVLYSAGVGFHLWDRLRFQNAIWHAFVVSGAVLQWCAVSDAVTTAAAG